jgi:hypothetical protein
MCLFKDQYLHPHNRPLIAKEDIVCYKQVCRHSCGLYETPYTNTIIPTESIENKIPFKAKIDKKLRFFCAHVLGTTSIVDDGFIHVYKHPHRQFGLTTFECMIPKGTKYFVGFHGDLAAKEIIFLERVNCI